MVRGLEFDVCEMALTTYLCAKEHGVEFTALPIFLVRGFHHGAIQVLRDSAIKSPKDLEGKRVGIGRGYTVTTGVWARSILAEEYGVDLNSITWVLQGDEHVQSYRHPDNVESAKDGETMEGLLDSGDLAAVINVKHDRDDIVPLIPDAMERGINALIERGRYPINHLIAVRNDVLQQYPSLGSELFDAFTQSKRLYLDNLTAGRVSDPTPIDDMHLSLCSLGVDPLPYGVEPNREVLEALIEHATAQQILRKPVELSAVFDESTLGLTG
jgi:4,5-dihydroxyphthalate decarboxylase